eukprot:Clim_evm43s240 gene=Clim_evmTU43s240
MAPGTSLESSNGNDPTVTSPKQKQQHLNADDHESAIEQQVRPIDEQRLGSPEKNGAKPSQSGGVANLPKGDDYSPSELSEAESGLHMDQERHHAHQRVDTEDEDMEETDGSSSQHHHGDEALREAVRRSFEANGNKQDEENGEKNTTAHVGGTRGHTATPSSQHQQQNGFQPLDERAAGSGQQRGSLAQRAYHSVLTTVAPAIHVASQALSSMENQVYTALGDEAPNSPRSTAEGSQQSPRGGPRTNTGFSVGSSTMTSDHEGSEIDMLSPKSAAAPHFRSASMTGRSGSSGKSPVSHKRSRSMTPISRSYSPHGNLNRLKEAEAPAGRGFIGWILSAIYSLTLLSWVGWFFKLVLKYVASDIYWAAFDSYHCDWRPLTSEQRRIVMESVVTRDEVSEAIGYHSDHSIRRLRRNNSEIFNSNPSGNPGSVPESPLGTPRRNRKRLRKAYEIMDVMIAQTNMIAMRVFVWMLRKAWRAFYVFGVHYDEDEVERLREAMAKGPVILMPTHKSHIDYLMMLSFCYEHNLPMPAVVAGDNLNMPGIGRMLRAGGALFIRRNFMQDSDPLYYIVFRNVVKELISAGENIEVFIEGGRSRSGKLLPPRIGVLRTIVDAVTDGTVPDVQLVPIALCYDRIVENESHVLELAGGQKTKETTAQTLRNVLTMMTNAYTEVNTFGRVDIRIAQPFSLRGYMQQFARERNWEDVMTAESKKHLSFAVGYRALYEMNKASVVSCAALVATVLLTHYQRALKKHTLLREVHWLSDLISARGGRVQPITDDNINLVISLVLEKIVGNNQLVKRHKDRFMLKLYNPRERLELSLYRNQLIHYFVAEGLVACAIYSIEKRDGGLAQPCDADIHTIEKRVRFLANMLKYEFVYKPSPNVTEDVQDTARQMERFGVLKKADDGIYRVNEDPTTATGGQRTNPDELEAPGTATYLFFCSLFWHFIDSYFLTALTLYTILPNQAITAEALISRIQAVGENMYFEGQLDLFEAVAKDTIANALNLFENWKVIEYVRVEGTVTKGAPQRIVRLCHDYDNEEALTELINKISVYRKTCRAFRSRRYRARGMMNPMLTAMRTALEEKSQWRDKVLTSKSG